MARRLSLLASAAAMIAVVASLALASCSSDGGTATPSDLSSAAKAKWNDYCAYRTACQFSTPCPPTMCLAAIAEEAPLIQFVDCQTAKTCDVNDDACIASAGTTDAERQDFTTRCQAALTAAQDPSCAVEPEVCTIVAYPLLRKQIMHAVDACLPKACADRKPCIDAAIAPLNCW